jgi:methionyl aminopeptidase
MIPFPVTPTRPVPDHIPRPDYALKEELLEEEPIMELDSPIPIKTEEELQGIKIACSFARSMLELAGGLVKSGITTDEIDRKVHSAIVEAGGYPSLLGNCGFPKSLHTNLNEVLVQGIPDCRPLAEGDVLTINLAVFFNGFHGACGATYYVGSNERLQEDHWAKRLIHNARRALEVGCSEVKPNAPLSRVGAMIEKFVVEGKASPHPKKELLHNTHNTRSLLLFLTLQFFFLIPKEERYGVFADNLGHGIGQRLFEMPYVFHTATDLTHTLEAGMVFTIEPVVTEGDSTKQTKWKNGFTLATRDRGRSAQFKETVLVTPQGFQILTASTSQQTSSS